MATQPALQCWFMAAERADFVVQCTYNESVMSDKVQKRSRAIPNRSKRINIRASVQQEELILKGAEQRKETLTEFIVEGACAEAEETLADQQVFLLSEERWAAFVAALYRPPRPRPRLQRLFAEPSILE
jgi:uncharacterized protein (DUF1778 family)